MRFPRPQLARPSGGVAAAKPSHRGLWLFVLLILAILLGFGFVRFFLTTPPSDASLRSPGAAGGPGLCRNV